jgi:hypothetical protein
MNELTSRINGVGEREGLYQQFAAAQARGYEDHLDDLRREGRALPGSPGVTSG